MNKFKLYLGICFFAYLTGCANNDKVLFVDVKKKPNYLNNQDFSCFNKIVSQASPNRGFAIFFNKVYDGSVPKGHNGPLMDHNDMLFKFYLKTALPDTQARLFESIPLIYERGNSGSVGVNRFNTPKKVEDDAYRNYIKLVLDRERIRNNKNPIKEISVYRIDAAFTRNDSNEFYSNAKNVDGKYRNDNNNGSGSITISESQKNIGLTVNIINLFDGSISASESFNLVYDTSRNRYKLGVGLEHFSVSSSFSLTKIESVDSAQDVLVRAAATWVMNKLFNNAYQHKFKNQCINIKDKKL